MNSVYEAVGKLIGQSEPPAFAVFDFDNTCIVNDITEATLAYMARDSLLRDKSLLGTGFENASDKTYSGAVFNHYFELIDNNNIEDAYEFISKILSGFRPDEINSLVNKVIQFEGQNITTNTLFGREIAKGLKLREEIIQLMHLCENSGIEVWIISASIEILVKEAMKQFNITGEVIGVRTSIVGGKFTDQLEQPLSMFEGKVECIKKYIDPDKKPLLGVGDSIYDLPMLEYCETKVVVDRQNALAARAKENNWFLM